MIAGVGDLITAVRDWRGLLGENRVLPEERALERYGPNTEGTERRIAAALLPRNAEEVAGLVRIAARHKIPLYPISTGNNWGYGSATPVVDDCVVVDLSLMNRILAMDRELGLVTVEPGVTQGQLYEYLAHEGLAYIASINGAGPHCSLLGNALERGFENFPYLDRFASVMSLEAVLPSGELYCPALSGMGAPESDRTYKWGLGPYLDGLFSQGNFGIVTRITFALFPRPERIDAFTLRIEKDEKLEKFIVGIRELHKAIGPMMGLVRMVNPFRLATSVGVPYPFERVPSGKAIRRPVMAELCGEYRLPAWCGAGSVFGPEKVVSSLRSVVREKLSPCVDRMTFTTQRFGKSRAQSGEPGEMNLLEPREIGLLEAYWKLGKPEKSPMHPARDGCGILWYAPIVPLKPSAARAYARLVDTLCPKYGIFPESSVILSTHTYFYGVTPLLFNRDSREETEQAHACYEALFRAGKEKGFLPYRVPAHAMKLIADPDVSFWRLGLLLKEAVDPDRILAPGRYSL